jgi:hypothetical protein
MGLEPLAFDSVVGTLHGWCERTVKVFVDARPSGRLVVRLLGRLAFEGEDIPESQRATGRVVAFRVGDDRLLLHEAGFDEATWVSEEREFLLIYDAEVCIGVSLQPEE